MTDILNDHHYSRGQAAAARATGGTDAMALARSVGLMVLHPLCVQTGRTRDVLTWLNRNGFLVFSLGEVQLTADDIHELWRREIPHRDGLRVQVFQSLLTWHRALLLGVVDQGERAETTSVRLSRLKGPSDPADCAPGQLRKTLGAANLLNNLVHTSDAPRAVLREASILLGARIDYFWNDARLALAGQPSTTVPPGISCAFDDALGVSLVHVAAAYRRRLLHELVVEQACDRCDPAPLSALVQRVECREEAWLASQDARRPVEVLARYRRAAEAYAPQLPTAVACPHRPLGARAGTLLEAVRGTESVLLGTIAPEDPREFLSAGSRAGVAADPREIIALMSEYAVIRVGGHASA